MRALSFIAALAVLVGCQTTAAPETTDQATIHAIIKETDKANKQAQAAQMAAERISYGKALLRELTDNCQRVHLGHMVDGNAINCSYTYPTGLTLSFPTTEYHDRYYDDIAKFFSKWCSAVWHITGRPSEFTRIARETGYTETTPCEVPE